MDRRLGCLFFLVLGFLFVSAGQASASSKGPELTTRGYSIFDGTMADMTFPEIEKAAREKAVVIFPIGVIEEHGPHLPLATDTYEGYVKAKLLKGELAQRGIQALIAPPFYWGINSATGAFAGSFTSREETVVSVLWDALASLKRWGFENVFFVNNHGDADHNLAVLAAIRKARLDTGTRASYVLDNGLAKRLGLTGREPYVLVYPASPPAPAKYVEVHAGGGETSVMWHYFPDLVNLEIWKTLKSSETTTDGLMIWRRGWEDARKVTPQGFLGDPTTASPERGAKAYEDFTTSAAETIARFLRGEYRPVEPK